MIGGVVSVGRRPEKCLNGGSALLDFGKRRDVPVEVHLAGYLEEGALQNVATPVRARGCGGWAARRVRLSAEHGVRVVAYEAIRVHLEVVGERPRSLLWRVDAHRRRWVRRVCNCVRECKTAFVEHDVAVGGTGGRDAEVD